MMETKSDSVAQSTKAKKKKEQPQPEKVINIPWDGGRAKLRLRGEYYHIDLIPSSSNGFRIRKATYERDPAKAKRHLDKLLGQLTRGEYVSAAENMTVETIINEYLDLFKRKLDPVVYAGYRRYADKLFIPRFKDLRPADLTPQMILDYRIARSKEPKGNGCNRKKETPKTKTIGFVSDSTIDRELRFLRAVFNWKHELNKTVLPTMPKFTFMNPKNRRTGFITFEQFETTLLPTLPFHLRALACCAITWGGRRKEWLRLDWSDIDFDNRVIHFDETKARVPREVAIIPGLMEKLLRELKAYHDLTAPEEDAVFTYKGKRLSEFKTSWHTATKGAGLQGLIFHDTRRSASKFLRDAGLTQKMIMDGMGHKTDSMFRHYGVKAKEDLELGSNLIEQHMTKMKNKKASQ